MALIESGRDHRAPQKTAGAPILNISNVCKSFDFAFNGNSARASLDLNHQVLRGLELKINEGEFVTIVGSSGCGKSTLLNIVAGLERPDSGEVFVRGSND